MTNHAAQLAIIKHVTRQESRSSAGPDHVTEEVARVMKDAIDGKYRFIRFKGIMGMATFTDDESVIREDFRRLRAVFDEARRSSPLFTDDFSEFSIGMSDDYRIAIEYGSTMVRVGSMIFGERNY